MIRLGDHVKHRLKVYDSAIGGNLTETTVDATVVYVHPERRYYVLRFELGPGRCFREAFQIIE